MKLRNIRWRYDGDGIACGPIEVNAIVEVCATHENHNYFICGSRTSEFMKIEIAPIMLFDLLMYMNCYDEDFEIEKISANIGECKEDEWQETLSTKIFISMFNYICLQQGQPC